ncbi:hypothetical protein ACH5RR_021517 [Cinchona calisaya]|uniref:Uncharacterized protein n=1 Tax=Cinchona calisaya TaxID=153742 RepID=A0ABD2ZMH4_9GENT
MDKLQWGNRKRLRCVKKITSRFADNNNNNNNNKEPVASLPPLPSPHRINNRDLGMSRSNGNENRKAFVSLSSEKEDRCRTTRGSVGLDDDSRIFMDAKKEKKKLALPKLLITLSNKEK